MVDDSLCCITWPFMCEDLPLYSKRACLRMARCNGSCLKPPVDLDWSLFWSYTPGDMEAKASLTGRKIRAYSSWIAHHRVVRDVNLHHNSTTCGQQHVAIRYRSRAYPMSLRTKTALLQESRPSVTDASEATFSPTSWQLFIIQTRNRGHDISTMRRRACIYPTKLSRTLANHGIQFLPD
ncbi:hypothetical protein VNO77_02759 [Canavalia gladiata]|uniref:Uncharacterized protein n=1 Tax=Canavalia gladiata TaxID=3824 RepID=A0AAN9MTK8_CANGL